MDRIGVRELRQHASRYVERVAAGETIEVTDRGRLVARLVPVTRTGMDALVTDGRVSRAASDLLLVEPVPLPPGARPPSERISEMRDE